MLYGFVAVVQYNYIYTVYNTGGSNVGYRWFQCWVQALNQTSSYFHVVQPSSLEHSHGVRVAYYRLYTGSHVNLSAIHNKDELAGGASSSSPKCSACRAREHGAHVQLCGSLRGCVICASTSGNPSI